MKAKLKVEDFVDEKKNSNEAKSLTKNNIGDYVIFIF